MAFQDDSNILQWSKHFNAISLWNEEAKSQGVYMSHNYLAVRDCETLEGKKEKEFNNKWRSKQATSKQANKSKPYTHNMALRVMGSILHSYLIAFGVLLFYNFIFLFLAELGLCCFAQAFSSCGAQAWHCSGLWSTALGRAGFRSRWMWAQQLQFPFSRAQAQ